MSRPIECWAVKYATNGILELKADEDEARQCWLSNTGNRAVHLTEDRGERDALRRVLEAVQAYDDARVELVCPSAIEQWRLRRCEAIAAGWKALGET